MQLRGPLLPWRSSQLAKPAAITVVTGFALAMKLPDGAAWLKHHCSHRICSGCVENARSSPKGQK